MTALSDVAENLVIDWLLTSGSAARPAGAFVALFTSDPTDAGSGTEVSGAGYARQAATFDAAASGATANAAALAFTAAGGDFGTVSHMAVFDAVSGGNMLFYSPLIDASAQPTTKTIADGDTLQFAAGDIDFSID